MRATGFHTASIVALIERTAKRRAQRWGAT
jgi:hypothetical protein